MPSLRWAYLAAFRQDDLADFCPSHCAGCCPKAKYLGVQLKPPWGEPEASTDMFSE